MYIKWGYGKATDHASREIRLKRMTRAEGIDLVKKYGDVWPKDTDLFLKWMDFSSKKDFFRILDRFRSDAIWERKGDGWKLIDSMINYKRAERDARVALEKTENCIFNDGSKRVKGMEVDDYTLIGRGWVDDY